MIFCDCPKDWLGSFTGQDNEREKATIIMSKKIRYGRTRFRKSSVFSTVRCFHSMCTFQNQPRIFRLHMHQTFYPIAIRSQFGACLLSKCKFFHRSISQNPIAISSTFRIWTLKCLDTQAKGCIAQSTQMPKSIIAHWQTIHEPHWHKLTERPHLDTKNDCNKIAEKHRKTLRSYA